jgi:hypothetical protein
MPVKPAWFPRIGSTLADVRVLNSDYLDRKAVERIFGVPLHVDPNRALQP